VPYADEMAPRLGHASLITDPVLKGRMARWTKGWSSGVPSKEDIVSRCRPLESLPGAGAAANVRRVVTVDGSPSEVPIAEPEPEGPPCHVDAVQVGCAAIDLDAWSVVCEDRPPKPGAIGHAIQQHAIPTLLAGRGYGEDDFGVIDERRRDFNEDLTLRPVGFGSSLTLADALLTLFGNPGAPATSVPIGHCPACGEYESEPVHVGIHGGTCPRCGVELFLGDVLRIHEHHSSDKLSDATGQIMTSMERLLMVGQMETAVRAGSSHSLSETLFITDGPLALFGRRDPLRRLLLDYHGKLNSLYGPWSPLLVGLVKTGDFRVHADHVRKHIPADSVMDLDLPYINKVKGNPPGTDYGSTTYYGRRFFFKTHRGALLELIIPPRNGVVPYSGSDTIDDYPALRPVCEVLRELHTHVFPGDALVPVVAANSAAGLPQGVARADIRNAVRRSLGWAPSPLPSRYMYGEGLGYFDN
jgi:hypothetical protein